VTGVIAAAPSHHDSIRGDHIVRHRSALLKLLALLAVFGLVAAACGDSDGGDGESTATSEAGGEGEEGEDGGSATTLPVTSSTSEAAAGEPEHGGRLVYGIEADSANPWVHYATSCAISCRMIFRAISDPLFVTTEAGDLVPYLVDTVESNADLTEWTMTIKDGIFFHDGTPLDGPAVAENIMACKLSALTGPSLLAVENAVGDGQTVTVTYNRPDALGPTVLREEVCGYMFSPEWMRTLDTYPIEELKTGGGDQTAPVGVGPFVFESYTPGNGNSFIATRNPDYWRGDGPNSVTGEGLPYLDEIEFVVAVDIQGRSNGLQSGNFDIIHTANADEINKFVGDDDFTLLQSNAFGETSYILLNVGAGENPTLAAVRGVPNLPMDPGNLNAESPLLNLHCRKALAHAIDYDEWAEVRGAGIVEVANGPFPPGSVGYLADTGYPQYDPAAANAEMDICLSEIGKDSVEFSFNTTNDPFNVESNTLTVSMWQEVFGDKVNVTVAPIEQGQYIGLALAGTFQAQGWRNHAGVKPGEQWYWWNSATASPIDPEAGELALNFGRFQDAEMDAQFATILTSPDEAARKAAAEEVNRLFGQNVWNFWYVWTLWGVIANPQVQNITDLTIPGNDAPIFPIIAGKHHLAQMWCLEGNCQA
jgi:peptide/nickel transport system substrate-binding protein